jgi:hypothetical protein
VAAFVALETDVRAKISSLPAAAAALLDAAKKEAEQVIATLLSDLPIPTNVNLSYTWNPTIQSFEPVFLLDPGASFSVTASAQAGLGPQLNSVAASFDIQARLTNFSIQLIGEVPFITLKIDSLTFTSHNGSKPDCRLVLNKVVFGDQLKFVEELASVLDPSEGPYIELADAAIRAGFRFAIPSLTMGAFNLMQLAIDVAVALPFDGDPVRCELGLSDQEHPFLLSCGIFGGGGFLQLQLGLDGVQLLQGALEFGVCAAINIGPLQGSGFVVAGIYMRITKEASEVCGFVHAHGHMDIFGIISMDVDLYVGVCYSDPDVVGEATFTVSVSIGFFSESFGMTARYQFAGKKSSSSPAQQPAIEEGDALTHEALRIPGNQRDKRAAQPASAPHGSPCSPVHAAPLFVDQKIWSKYYNSFV